MTVYCGNDECKWNQGYECNRGVISLDYDGECEDFESYLDDAEWHKPYWKRLVDRETNQVYRVLALAKDNLRSVRAYSTSVCELQCLVFFL